MKHIVIKEIGAGGFGRVDLIQVEGGWQYAKKSFFYPTGIEISKDDLKRRFRREVEYQKAFVHPNIAKIVYSDLDAEPPFYVMELAQCTLSDILKANPKIAANLDNVLFDVLAGLEALHQNGIVHRDLKPANILRFNNPDGSARYAISDFGLVSAQGSESTTLTATNQAGGTQNYSAPECAISLKAASSQSDIYSFGALLHDIFGGGARRVPYTKLSVPDQKLNPIVEKCTQKAAKLRYGSIAELRSDLFEALKGHVVTFSSTEEANLVEALATPAILTEDDWDRILILIDDNDSAGVSNQNIFNALKDEHWNILHQNHPERFLAIAKDYCRWIEDGVFDFGACDVLAHRLQIIYSLGSLELKAYAAIAALSMGTSHNRWYVERVFHSMANKTITNELANRIKMEVAARQLSFASMMQHLERSIGLSASEFHPILAQMAIEGAIA